MSNQPAPDNPDAGDIETASLYGEPPSGEVPDPENADLRSADTDPLPDAQVSDPNSTPQGPA